MNGTYPLQIQSENTTIPIFLEIIWIKEMSVAKTLRGYQDINQVPERLIKWPNFPGFRSCMDFNLKCQIWFQVSDNFNRFCGLASQWQIKKANKSYISRIEPDIWKHVEKLLESSDLNKRKERRKLLFHGKRFNMDRPCKNTHV